MKFFDPLQMLTTINFATIYGKAEFSASLLQSVVSHDPSEIIREHADLIIRIIF